MPVPPLPKKNGFLSHVQASKETKKPEPKAEIVSRRRNKTLEPWMLGVAYNAFRAAGTVRSVASMLNVTESRLSGWLADSEAEECEDDLLLEFGHLCRKGREEVNTELLGHWRLHALSDAKACMELARALNPELQITKKVEQKVQVEPPRPQNYDALTEEEKWALRAIEKKLASG